MTRVGTDEVARTLAAKREQLQAQLTSMSAPVEAGSISFGKRVGEGTSQAVDRLSAVPAHDRLQDMLADVIRAQLKLSENNYGSCDVCGRDIGVGRLGARPWATRCIDHA